MIRLRCLTSFIYALHALATCPRGLVNVEFECRGGDTYTLHTGRRGVGMSVSTMNHCVGGVVAVHSDVSASTSSARQHDHMSRR